MNAWANNVWILVYRWQFSFYFTLRVNSIYVSNARLLLVIVLKGICGFYGESEQVMESPGGK